jgi:hypothetical protein
LLPTLIVSSSAFLSAGHANAPPNGQASEYRFDFGPTDSPVADGYTACSASAAYSPERGFGWSAGAPQDYTAPKPAPRRTYWWHADPVHFFGQITDDFRHDGGESEKPFSFRIDLPKGRYRAEVTVGHLAEPRYGIDVDANGRLVRKRVDARLWLFRGVLHKASGYYKRVRFSVDVADDGLVLDFQGDDAEFRRLMKIEKAKGPDERPHSRFKGEPLGPDMAPFQDIGGPFTKISLMGLEVYPERALPPERVPDFLSTRAAPLRRIAPPPTCDSPPAPAARVPAARGWRCPT